MKRLSFRLAAGLLLLAATPWLRGEFIVAADTFSRQGYLHNTWPDQGDSRWVADGAWLTDGSRATVGTPNRLAYLPFKPRAGNRYTLSVRLRCTSATPASEWISCGFAKGMATQGAWHLTNSPTGWMLIRAVSDATNQLQTFPGGNAGVFNGEHRLSVVLDTRPALPADWTFTFLVDGQTVKGPVAATGAAQITSVGLGNGAGLGWGDDFSLTSLVDDRLANLVESIRALAPPFAGSPNLILPVMPAGFSIAVKSSSRPDVVGLDGTVAPPDTATVVTLILTVTRDADGQTADTVPLQVFIPAARSGSSAPAYAENFRLRQGLFITWTGMPDGQTNPIRFSDGSQATSMDAFADSADVTAVTDQVARFGFDHVVLMDLHGAGTTLHPCAALDSWRGPGFTSRRDLIGEMIAAFKARHIKVYLFTHPLDGHDYSAEQQALLGFNDPTNGHQKWNDFINDVHAEIVERYGQDIVGIGMDSEFGLSTDPRWAGKLDLPRLRATILARRPDLALGALTGPNDTCEFGIKEVWRPSWLDPWNSRAETDYHVETWPAYRRVAAIVEGYHWATVIPPSQGVARLTGRQMFRYSVLQAAAATEGPGVQWAASPYTDGSWENGVSEAFTDLEALVRPVSESLRDVYPSTSYPTAEGAFLSTLSHGVAATRKTDDSVEFLHVLDPPAGKTLTLPAPADGKLFLDARLLANGRPIQLSQSPAGVSLTLGAQDTWSTTDTVIRLTVTPESRPPRNLALHAAVSSSSAVQMGGGLASQVPWGRIRLVDGLRASEALPASWSVPIHGWSSATTAASTPQWVQVDLGVSHSIDTVRLHPRNDAGNAGFGFPVDFQLRLSPDGRDWTMVASVTGQPMPNGPVELHFAPHSGRFVRLAASLLRPNPSDAGRYAFQLAELEVFGPASTFTVESSAELWDGFAEDPSAFVRINPREVSVPLDGGRKFFRLRGDPPPMVRGLRRQSSNFIIEYE